MKLSLLASVVALALCPACATSPAAPEPVVGPAADIMRPPAKPLDLRTRALDPKVNREWLQSDVDMLWRVRSLLPPVPDAGAFFASIHAERGAREQRDLDFGLKRESTGIAGGYTSCTFTGISYQDGLVAVRVDCGTSTDPDTLTAITPIIEEALGRGFSRDGAASTVWLFEKSTFELPAANARARAALDRDLGSLTPVDVGALAADVAHAYAVMMSPLEDLAVGASCGFAGVPPHGREEAQVLERAARIDLLRNVLRSPNPEARAYAARALAKLGAMNAADVAVIEKLSARSYQIKTCSGCTYFSTPSGEVFHAKD